MIHYVVLSINSILQAAGLEQIREHELRGAGERCIAIIR